MSQRQEPTQNRTVGWFLLATLILTTGNANAQFAKVKGSITDQTKAKGVHSSVLVKTADEKRVVRVVDADLGDYTIDNILAGKYEFFACGMPFRPNHKTVSLAPEQSATINLVLNDPYDAPRIKLAPDNMEDSTDRILYLRDAKSKCFVAQAYANSKGEYEFTNWHDGDQLCVRKRRRDNAGEEYVCDSTLH